MLGQNLTMVTASRIEDSSAQTLTNGTVCFQPVAASGGLAVATNGFGIGGGGIAHGRAVCRTVTNGAITSFNIAASDHTSPVGIQYTINVTDNNTQEQWTIGTAFISGSTWSLDGFIPGGITTLPNPGSSAITGALTVGGSASVSGALTVNGSINAGIAITAPNFHGLADHAVTSQRWATLPQSCPSGFSPSHQDVNGNFLDCNANSFQASGTSTGVIAQAPAGNQMVTIPSTSFMRFGTSASYSEFDASGTLFAANLSTNGPEIDPTYWMYGADKTGTIESHAQINSAITAAVAAKGPLGNPPTIHLPRGVYKVSAPIILPACAHLTGDGQNSTIIQLADGSGTSLILAPSSVGIGFCQTVVDNIGFYGDGHKTTGTMIEDFVTHAIFDKFRIFNHGGRGMVFASNDERTHVTNFSIDSVRWPWINFGTNEIYAQFGEVVTPNRTDTSDGGGYSYNINCTNGVCPTSGNWLQDPHFAIYSDLTDNVAFKNMSIKSLAQINGICLSTQVAEVSNVYMESQFVSNPSIQTAIQADCQTMDKWVGAAALGTTGAPQITDTTWMPIFVGETAYESAFTKTKTFDIMCADAAPGSSTTCAGDSGHTQGTFERITATSVTPDGVLQGVLRCQAGSNSGCTVGTGIGSVWAVGWHMMEGGYKTGQGAPYIHDNHINVSAALNFGSLTGQCNDTIAGQQCADIVVGKKVDGIEVTAPGQPIGFSGINQAAGRNSIRLGQNAFSNQLFGAAGSGAVKVFTSGTIACDVPMEYGGTGVGGGLSQATDDPRVQLLISGPCPYQFTNYGSGHYAWGQFTAPGWSVQSPALNGSFIAPYFPTNSSDTPGPTFYDGECHYSFGLSGAHSPTRICIKGPPDNDSQLSFESWSGSAWVPQYVLHSDGTVTGSNAAQAVAKNVNNNFSTSQSIEGTGIGNLSNLVAQSGNFTASPWHQIFANTFALTADTTDTPDPWNKNTATKFVFTSGATVAQLANSGTTLLASSVYNVCAWLRGASGGETMNLGLANINGTTLTLTTSWQYLCSTLTTGTVNLDRTGYVQDSGASETFYVAGLSVTTPPTDTVYLATGNTPAAVRTPSASFGPNGAALGVVPGISTGCTMTLGKFVNTNVPGATLKVPVCD